MNGSPSSLDTCDKTEMKKPRVNESFPQIVSSTGIQPKFKLSYRDFFLSPLLVSVVLQVLFPFVMAFIWKLYPEPKCADNTCHCLPSTLFWLMTVFMNLFFWVLFISLRAGCCCTEYCIWGRDHVCFSILSIMGFLGQTSYQIAMTLFFSMSHLKSCQSIGASAIPVCLIFFLCGIFLIISSTLLIIYKNIYIRDEIGNITNK